jgi:hypothetical protein
MDVDRINSSLPCICSEINQQKQQPTITNIIRPHATKRGAFFHKKRRKTTMKTIGSIG